MGINHNKTCKGEIHTVAMNPQKRTCRFPLFEGVLLNKPQGGFVVMDLASNIMIRRLVWRRPTSKILSDWSPVTATSEPTSIEGDVVRVRTIRLVYLFCCLLREDFAATVRKDAHSPMSVRHT